MAKSMHGLHKALGGLEAQRREALAGKCALPHCDENAAGFIEGWDRARGICTTHIPEARQHGYTVHEADKQ